MKRLLLLPLVLFLVACGFRVPPTTEPAVKGAYVALDTVRDVAVRLNKIEITDGERKVKALSDEDKEFVLSEVEQGRKALALFPDTWKETTIFVLDRLSNRVGYDSQLSFYIQAAKRAVQEL